jgi:hypothetical protein
VFVFKKIVSIDFAQREFFVDQKRWNYRDTPSNFSPVKMETERIQAKRLCFDSFILHFAEALSKTKAKHNVLKVKLALLFSLMIIFHQKKNGACFISLSVVEDKSESSHVKIKLALFYR